MHRKVARMLLPEWRDTAKWPVPPLNAIRPEYRESYESRKRAIEAYVRGDPLNDIRRDEAIDSAVLYALFEACIRLDKDGAIAGFQSLIPYARNKQYERSAPSNVDFAASGRGMAGLFRVLLEEHEDLQEFLAAQAKKYVGPEWDRRRLPVGEEHRKFLTRLAKKAPLKGYPFNLVNKGREGYRRALHAAISLERGRLAKRYHPSHAREFLGDCNDFYRQLQIDAHRLDKAIPIKFIGRKGRSKIRLIRPWLLVGVECESTASLGWYLSLEDEPTEFDALNCFYNVMRPWNRRERFQIEGLAYKEGAGMPSGLIERCRCRFSDSVAIDNALAHHANNLRKVVLKVFHATLKLGFPGQPRTRTEIEQLFNTVTHRNIQHLIGGVRPDMSNRERKQSHKKSERFGMTVEQIEEYLDVVLADRNVHPSSAFYSKSPLEYLGEEPDQALVRADDSPTASWRKMLKLELRLTVRASDGHLPHVNYEGASYSSAVLRVAAHLVRTMIIVVVNLSELQTCEAFLSDGKPLGTLVAERRWQFPHDYRLRKKLNAAINDGRFVWVPSKTPEESVREFLASQGQRLGKAKAATGNAVTGPNSGTKVDALSMLAPRSSPVIADVAAGEYFDLQQMLGKRLKG